MTANAAAGNIHFTPERWPAVRASHRRWLAGDLGRPLLQIRLENCPARPCPPAAAAQWFTAAFGDIPADDIIDCWDYELSRQRFLGDAFPTMWLNYGPGVAAAFLGCRLEVSPQRDTVWFHPETIVEPESLRFAADFTANPYWQQMQAVIASAGRRWQGLVQVGLTDIGGTMDVLSSFRPSEALLYDLYDHPETVARLIWEIHRHWWDIYDRQRGAVLAAGIPGTTCWTPIFSDARYYMLQCDFSYMISPEMFAQFVLPELTASCRKLDHAFYHLDGIGELPHLDMLLAIPELTGIQWVPGDGQPDITHWPEVYRKIAAAGKKIQIWGQGADGIRAFETIAEQTGRPEQIAAIISADACDAAMMEEFLHKWGA